MKNTKMTSAIVIIVLMLISLLGISMAETTTEDLWAAFGNFEMPTISGFGDNDWFSNFEIPENFGQADWSKFGTPINGVDWGSIGSQENNADFSEKWNSMLESMSSLKGSNGDESDTSLFDSMKSQFESKKQETEDSSEADSTVSITDLFSAKTGKQSGLSDNLGMPDLPVTLEELKSSLSDRKNNYETAITGLVDEKLNTLGSLMESVKTEAEDIKSDTSLTDFSKKEAYQAPSTDTSVRELFESNTSSLSDKIVSPDLDSYKSTGEALVGKANSAGSENKGKVLDLYTPITND